MQLDCRTAIGSWKTPGILSQSIHPSTSHLLVCFIGDKEKKTCNKLGPLFSKEETAF